MEDYYIGGIDEAGRGPVLGPMVYSLAIIKKSHYIAFGKWWNKMTYGGKTSFQDFLEKNKDLLNNEFNSSEFKEKYKDSKMLNIQEREKLFGILKNLKDNTDLIDFKTFSITAKEISGQMFKDEKKNLNEIAKEATLSLIDDFDKKYKIDTIFVDTLGPAEKHQDFLKRNFNNINFIVRSKMDTLISITSATSVCAKYIRDYDLNNYKFKEKDFSRNFGIGYPTDPVSISWWKNNSDEVFGFSDFVRFSWKTAYSLLDNYTFYSEEDLKEEKKNLDKKLEIKKSFFKKSNLVYDFKI